jgi:hypothetical protein
MNFRFGASYSPAECNTAMILDRFLILALIGFSIIIIIMLVIRRANLCFHSLLQPLRQLASRSLHITYISQQPMRQPQTPLFCLIRFGSDTYSGHFQFPFMAGFSIGLV